ncbi:hypothetical protein B0H14DRAFT_3906344 [Mycena olivaceomarginata]|nr:hypothetical protein B0H14DRAFT_3906344 [Mycena olivaceomarginata]
MTAPDVTDKNALLRLWRLPVLEAKIIRKLIESSWQAYLDGYRSLMYSHISSDVTTHFPLWVLTYWNALVDFKRNFHGPWVQAQTWQNDMLELLRHKINSNPELAPCLRVQGVELVPKIIKAFKTAGTDAYQTDRSFHWIRNLAEDLVQNTTALITTGHLGGITEEPHWISLVIDLSKPGAAVTRYGDGFGRHIPAELLDACRGFSCGMLAENSQQHFVDPSIPLSVLADWAQARCETFNKIAQRGLERLEIERNLAIAEDKDSESEFGNYTATLDDSDSDDAAVQRAPRFTFTFPIPSSGPTPPTLLRPLG